MEASLKFIRENSYVFSGGLLVGVGWWLWKRSHDEISIPKYGFSIPLPRIFCSIKIMIEGYRAAFLKLYAKYPIAMVPAQGHWMVIVQGKYIDEVNAAPEDVLSFDVAMEEILQSRYTMGINLTEDTYHQKPIHNQMTRKLNTIYPEIHEDIAFAVVDKLKEAETSWQTVKALEFVQSVVACSTNRVFVGLPLCRNPEWLALMQKNAIAVFTTSHLINGFPRFMRPFVGPLFSVKSKIKQASELLGSIVDERLAMDPQGWPEDYVSWLLAVAPEADKCTMEVAKSVLMVNFAAIHTTTMTLTHALYWLMARPQYIKSLRQEIEEVTNEMGWTKDGISNMVKLDSFIKECQRMNTLHVLTMNRTAVKPFTFSNGVKIPPGTMLGAHQWAAHRDGQNYSNPDEFDGERFVEKDRVHAQDVGVENDVNGERGNGEQKGENAGTKKTMYSTSKTYLPFGHGKHACPGRFFAALELKGIMAYIIANYDVKWPDNVQLDSNGQHRPKDMWLSIICLPNSNAKVMFRKRSKA